MKCICRRTLATVIAAVGLIAVLRRWSLRWGTTHDELRRELPGDDLTPAADLVSTRAITIEADADDVWPWIAQLGQGRAGFYSYDFLENLAGADIHNAGTIVDEWQNIGVGDVVHLAPDVALTVAAIEPRRALVLHAGTSMGPMMVPYDFTWAFVLRELPNGSTRLVVRERYVYLHCWARALVEPVEFISFLMSQRMLRGIRERVLSQGATLAR